MGETKMLTKRNIATCFGTLLVLVTIFAPAAAAADVELDLSVSPENLVLGTYSKWTSVCVHVEDAYPDCPYTANDINVGTVTLEIRDKYGNVNQIDAGTYNRYEYTDEDGDYYDELVLIYETKYLLKDPLKLDGAPLTFEANGCLNDGKTFTADCQAKTTLIKRPPGKGPGKGPGRGQ
jgi:hypothetical protein